MIDERKRDLVIYLWFGAIKASFTSFSLIFAGSHMNILTGIFKRIDLQVVWL